ncbi:MAG: zf-HC2 domain-containing protein [Ruminococcaceae bacterium]|nr:zf-HC2 domain-containing protein [Oscillospiraceae bacterium]
MQNCRKIRKNLHEFALGQLEGDIVRQIEQHLDECEECRRIFDAEKLYCENIGAVAAALSTLPENKNLSRAVTDVIEQEKDNPPVYISRRRFPTATAAALVLVMLIAVFAGRMGLMEDNNFTADTAGSIASADTANDEPTDSARLYAAVTDDSVPETVNAPAELYDEIIPEDNAVAVESDNSTKEMENDRPIMMMAAPPSSVSSVKASDETETDGQIYEEFATDTATSEPQPDDPALAVHKKVAEYNDFINSQALILLYPQVIMHGDEGEFYYDNFVRNNCGGPLIENTNFYCLHLSFDSLKNALDLCGITDYTVIQPDDPTRTDMVYIYYK